MHQKHDPALTQYPHGRGYGHDYMRGGEVLGGYGYAARDEYERPLGERSSAPEAEPRGNEPRAGSDGARSA